MVVGRPRPGEARLEVHARAVIALSSARLEDDLQRALGDAGYAVSVASNASEIGDLLDLDSRVTESVIAVLDDGHDDWLRAVSDLVGERPGIRPVMLASMDGAEEFLAAVTAGVAGFCSPDADIAAIVRTIESVRESGVAIPRDMVPPLVDHVRHGRGHRVETAAGAIDVTDREWEILQLLIQRRSTREMADTLFVSAGTVRSHVSTLLKKLGAVDREDAIAMVERGGRL